MDCTLTIRLSSNKPSMISAIWFANFSDFVIKDSRSKKSGDRRSKPTRSKSGRIIKFEREFDDKKEELQPRRLTKIERIAIDQSRNDDIFELFGNSATAQMEKEDIKETMVSSKEELAPLNYEEVKEIAYIPHGKDFLNKVFNARFDAETGEDSAKVWLQENRERILVAEADAARAQKSKRERETFNKKIKARIHKAEARGDNVEVQRLKAKRKEGYVKPLIPANVGDDKKKMLLREDRIKKKEKSLLKRAGAFKPKEEIPTIRKVNRAQAMMEKLEKDIAKADASRQSNRVREQKIVAKQVTKGIERNPQLDKTIHKVFYPIWKMLSKAVANKNRDSYELRQKYKLGKVEGNIVVYFGKTLGTFKIIEHVFDANTTCKKIYDWLMSTHGIRADKHLMLVKDKLLAPSLKLGMYDYGNVTSTGEKMITVSIFPTLENLEAEVRKVMPKSKREEHEEDKKIQPESCQDNPDLEIKTESSFESAYGAIKEFTKNIPGFSKLNDSTCGFIESSVILLFKLYREDGVADHFTTLYMYLRSEFKYSNAHTNVIAAALSLVSSSIKRWNKSANKEIKTESLSDRLLDFQCFLNSRGSSGLVDAIRVLLISLAAMKFFSLSLAWTIFSWCGRPRPGTTMFQLLRDCYTSVTQLVLAGELYASGVPISLITSCGNSRAVALAKAEQLTMTGDFLYSGLPVEGKRPREEWLDESKSVLTYIGKLIKTDHVENASYKEMLRIYNGLQAKYLSVRSAQQAEARIPPFGICIHSTPGVGKATLVDLCCHMMGSVKGRKYQPGQLFTRNANSEYWEGHDPNSQPYIRYPELGSKHRQIVSKQGDVLADELLTLIDGLPLPLNYANADQKGKNFANPWMVITDTNVPDMNFQHLFNNPSAFYRRMWFIEARVKEEFAREGGTQIDAKKSLNHAKEQGSSVLDRYEFQVYRKEAQTNKDSKDVYVLTFNDEDNNIYTLSSIMQNLMREHWKINSDFKDLISNSMQDPNFIDDMGFMVPEEEKKDFYADSHVVKSLNELKKELDLGRLHVSEKPNITEKFKEGINSLGNTLYDRFNLISKVVSSGEKILEDDETIERIESLLGDNNFLASPDSGVAFGHLDSTIFYDETKKRNANYVFSNVSALDVLVDIPIDDTEEDKSEVLGDNNKDTHHEDWKITTESFSTAEAKRYYAMARFRCKSKLREIYQNYKLKRNMESKGMISEFPVTIQLGSVFERVTGYVTNFDMNEKLADNSNLYYCWNTMSFYTQFFREIISGLLIFVFICMFMGLFHIPYKVMKAYKYVRLFLLFPALFYLIWLSWRLPMIMYIIFESLASMKFPGLELFSKYYVECLAREMWDNYQRYMIRKYSESWFGKFLKEYFPDQKSILLKTLGFMTVGVVGYKLWQWIRPNEKKRVKLEDGLTELEKEAGCGIGVVRVANKLGTSWDGNVISSAKGGCFNGTFEEAYKAVLKNVRQVSLNGGKTHILGYNGSLACINKHFLLGRNWKGEKMEISVTGNLSSRGTSSMILSDENVFFIKDQDIAILSVNGFSFRRMSQHFLNSYPKKGDVLSSYIKSQQTVAQVIKDDRWYTDLSGVKHTVEKVISYELKEHYEGMCGYPIIGEIGNKKAIIGFHMGCTENTDNCYGAMLSQKVFEEARLYFNDHENGGLLEIKGQSLFREEFSTPHPKSFAHYVNLENVVYEGHETSVTFVSDNVSSVIPSPAYTDNLESFFRDLMVDEEMEEYGAPHLKQFRVMGEWRSPYNVNVTNMVAKKKPIHRLILKRVVREITSRICDAFEADQLKMVPLTLDAAINGAEFDDFISGINTKTSGGWNFPGGKEKYFYTDETTGKRVATDFLRKRIIEVLDEYQLGNRVGPIYKACLKDEPRLVEKISLGKTRIFCMTPLDILLISRMFLAPFYSSMIERNELFCTAVGINMHKEADRIADRLLRFSNLIMEGDYSSYDQKMPFDIGLAACTIVRNVLSRRGYSKLAMTVVESLLSDLMFPRVEIRGDILEIPGYQPSGKYATAEDNSLRGLIMLMYAFYSMRPGRENFFGMVLPVTYGDDLLAAVKEEVSVWFNNISYGRFVRETYGMNYTDAKKGENMDPFTDIKQMSFLKRKFVYSKTFERTVAPLSLSSLRKTLKFYMPSKHVSSMDQILGASQSVLREFIFHVDCDVRLFNEFRDLIGQGLCLAFTSSSSIYLMDALPTYYSLVESLSLDEKAVSEEIQREIHTESGFSRDYYVSSRGKVAHASSFSRNPRNRVNTIRKEIEELTKAIDQYGITEEGIDVMTRSDLFMRSRRYRNRTEDMRSLLGHRRSLQLTLRFLAPFEKEFKTESEIHLESDTTGITFAEEEDTSAMREGTQADIDAGYVYKFSAPMDTFLERPIIIFDAALPLDVPIYNVVNPWREFLADPTVRSKIRNYATIRFDLELTIQVQGTPFHLGKILVAPVPHANTNLAYLTLSGSDAIARDRFLCAVKSSVRIPVGDNVPYKIHLPYLSSNPMARLFFNNGTVVSSLSDFSEFSNMHNLCISSLNRIRAVSDDATPAHLYVYANARNVMLGCPTGTPMEIKTESDERKTGPIERISSKLMLASDALRKIPVIAPYANASHAVFRTANEISALLGFSVPTTVEDPSRVKNEPYQNGCQTIGVDTGKRLTLDPLQELNVDGRACASEEDEMLINYITRRVGYVGTFVWPSSDGAIGPRMCMNPMLYQRNGENLIQLTPLGFASVPFSYWHGTLDLTLELVKSAFHRGKIAVIYEPAAANAQLIDSIGYKLNKQFIHVIDLQETDKITFRVGWSQNRPWLRVPTVDLAEAFYIDGVLESPDFYDSTCNGYITFKNLTNIISPKDVPLEINFYLSSNDIVFNELNTEHLPTEEIKTESDMSDDGIVYINKSSFSSNRLCDDYFGEVPVSFRALCKRFTQIAEYDTAPNTLLSTQTVSWSPQIFAPYKPSNSASTTHPVLLDFLRPCYVGMKGGMRFRLLVMGAGLAPCMPTRVSLLSHDDNSISGIEISTGFPFRHNGHVTFIPHTNGGIEFELPFYCSGLYVNPDGTPLNGNTIANYFVIDASGFSGKARFALERATAEDFTLMHFVAPTPIMPPPL